MSPIQPAADAEAVDVKKSAEETAAAMAPPVDDSTSGDAELPDEIELYCYCRAPYNEDNGNESAMIACDGKGCTIEWFHLRCCNVDVAPEGNWYCNECRAKKTRRRRRRGTLGR
jgi:inhibitor of growth protein 3